MVNCHHQGHSHAVCDDDMGDCYNTEHVGLDILGLKLKYEYRL